MAPQHSVDDLTGSELDLSELNQTLARICEIEAISQAVHIQLTSDDEIQRLNRGFRGVNASTDVLTFPSGQGAPFPLGDIAISVPYAFRQAEARGVSLHDEVIALMVHGVLHLVGLDDETEEDRSEMQRRMNELGDVIGTPIDASWTSVLHQEEE